PFLGSLLGLGVGLFATFISAALSLITIAIGWLFYRPLIGGAILAVAIAILAAYVYLCRGKRRADAAAPPEPTTSCRSAARASRRSHRLLLSGQPWRRVSFRCEP